MIAIYKPGVVGWDDFDYISEYADVPVGWTSVSPPQPCWKPVFDVESQNWIETGSDEKEAPVEEKPSLEIELETIKAELEEQKSQSLFFKEILLELADMILSDNLRGGN